MADLKVSLIEFTGSQADDPAKHAAASLAFTKNTRLSMSPEGKEAWLAKPWIVLDYELAYMAETIQSSWEFIDLTFSIENVTRACAQQITRTRTGSYAMQSQRVTDVSEMGFRIPPNATSGHKAIIKSSFDYAIQQYKTLIEDGCEPEDARSILPMNIQCNMQAKYNLRSWIDVWKARQSLRAQDEYREIVDLMLSEVRKVYPWIDIFLRNKHDSAIRMIEEIAALLPTEKKRALAKAADLLRKEG
jgi:flavin-dependent thymidylate synthase